MLYRVPEKLLTVICNYLIGQYLPPKKQKQKKGSPFNDMDLEFFARGAAALSNAFTKERAALPKNYLNRPEYRAGYILYFTATNYLKALFCLEEIDAKNRFGKNVNVLDIGTGPGTALIASADYFAPTHASLHQNGKKVTLTGIDQNGHILNDAKALITNYAGKNFPLTTLPRTVSPKNIANILGPKKYEIVFLSNFTSELRTMDERLHLINTLLQNHLSDNGCLIVIEPALQKTTRDLMELRDRMFEASARQSNSPCDAQLARSARNESTPLQDPRCHILSPCLHDLPCPMLAANRRDWCHAYLNWTRPLLIEKIDRLIGNKKDYLKFSYLIISPAVQTPSVSASTWRVVSAPLRSNGKTELLVCNKKGLIRLVRLDKDRSEANRFFDDLQRGNLAEYSGPERLTKESVIKKIL